MRYLTLGEVIALHRAIVASSGGGDGVRDLGALESALAQPKATLAVFLELNGFAIDASVDDQERLMLNLAAGLLPRDVPTAWVGAHAVPR